jgi:four helix bundle protein
MTIRSYADLVAWQKAVRLAMNVYRVSVALPREEQYGLTAQMRRASVSVAANIAEGHGRRTDGECLNQLSVAYGSLCELETHLILSERLGLLEETTVRAVLGEAAEVGRLVNGLMRSISEGRRERSLADR